MERFENILPYETKLDPSVEYFRDEIDELFDDNRQSYQDLIDPYSELHNDVVVMAKFADFCGNIFADHQGQQDDISRAVYRSICFANIVAKETLPGGYSCNLVSYMNERLQAVNSTEVLITDVQEYLQYREGLDTLIGYYAPEIDPTGQHHHVVELFSGMVFMLAERSLGEQYIQSQIDDLNPEDIINQAPPA